LWTCFTASTITPIKPQVARVITEDLTVKTPVKYALVIDGKALLYALSPMLRDLFLQVCCGPLAAGLAREIGQQLLECIRKLNPINGSTNPVHP